MTYDDDLLGDEIDITDLITPVTIYVENDIDTDADGNTIIQTFIFANKENSEEEDSSVEVTTTLNDLIDNTISYYVEEKSADSANALYILANDLSRHAETLRDKAEYMDRGLYTDDMFVGNT